MLFGARLTEAGGGQKLFWLCPKRRTIFKKGLPYVALKFEFGSFITSTTALSLTSSIITISNNYKELFDFGSHTFTKALVIDLQQKDLVDRLQQYCSLMIRIS